MVGREQRIVLVIDDQRVNLRSSTPIAVKNGDSLPLRLDTATAQFFVADGSRPLLDAGQKLN
jgi:hypothetical protein